MSQNLISRFHAYFPPIYKEEEGTSYVFNVFLKRVKWLLSVPVIFTVLFYTYIFIFPSSIPELKDWYGSFVRSLIVCLVVWLAYCAFVFMNRLNKDLEEIKARQSQENEEHLKEMAELFGTATALSIALSSYQENAISQEIKIPDEEVFLIQKLSEEIEKRNKTLHPSNSAISERVYGIEAFKQAIEIKMFFSYSGYSLFYPAEDLSDPSDKVAQQIISNLREDNPGFPKYSQLFLLRFSTVPGSHFSEKLGGKPTQELETKIMDTVEWLTSIKIGFKRSELPSDGLAFYGIRKNSKFKY